MNSLCLFLLTLSTYMSILHFSQAFDPKITSSTCDEEFDLQNSFGQSMTFTNVTPHLQTYIVHVNFPYVKQDIKSITFQELESLYYSFLPPMVDRQTRMVHSYRHVITGFAARLSQEEVKQMEKKDGFISATLENICTLQTTHSQTFMGLHQGTGLWNDSNKGSGVIIGVLDSGVALHHPSFGDEGMPPPPAKWRGKCKLGFPTCNNKLIGAVNFTKDTPKDITGHGTHVASIAAGHPVKDANVFLQATGCASGTAPSAHLAIYKVCTRIITPKNKVVDECPEAAILKGFEQAIEDRVDVINFSIGCEYNKKPLYDDNTAIASFAAIQLGIFVSSAAGNFGPGGATLTNQAPWLLTVGASTIDRNFRAIALLGNGVQVYGESLNQTNNFPTTVLFPLIYPGINGNQEAALCSPGAFNSINVTGMVVVCDAGGIGLVAKGQNVLNAGGAAMIIVNRQANGDSIPAGGGHVLPATHVGYKDGTDVIKKYINLSPSPQATIVFQGTQYGVINSPEVASFSSRGPNMVSPGILKPDIIGPGRNILAAWPYSVDGTTTRATYKVNSGTSMATPHLSGIAALLNKTHPDWSPAAMKSAIMTTATLFNNNCNRIMDQNKKEANWYDLGAGHVNPTRANDPGLVYDIQPDDYIPYLCGLNYTDQQVSIIAHRPCSCSTVSPISEAELNYPSFSITLPRHGAAQSYMRTVTNVGYAVSSYDFSADISPSVSMVVQPYRLSFTSINQKLTYTVTFSRNDNTRELVVPGFLTWTSSRHTVRSQIMAVLP